MISHLQMITIYVRDLDNAVTFYTDKLDFIKVAEFHDEENDFVWVMPKPSRSHKLATQIGLFAPKDASDPRIGSADGLVFTADDIEATYAELKKRGIHFTMDLVRHNYGEGEGDQEARFTDPDGNVFILHT